MKPEDFDEAAEKCADKILAAAGSGLRHYMPITKVKICVEARELLQEIYLNNFRDGLAATRQQPTERSK